jgi:hypothetical protein
LLQFTASLFNQGVDQIPDFSCTIKYHTVRSAMNSDSIPNFAKGKYPITRSMNMIYGTGYVVYTIPETDLGDSPLNKSGIGFR